MRAFKIFFICVFVTQKTFGSPILIQASESSDVDFKRYREKNPDILTFDEDFYQQQLQKAARFEVREKFVQAKAALLKGNITSSKNDFYALVQLALEADWNEADRSLLTHAFLALAEMAQTLNEKSYWVQKALAFSLGQIPEFQSLSQATQDLITKLKGKLRLISDQLNPQHTKWDKILINGQEILNNKKLVMGHEPYRVTFLSSKFKPLTQIIHSNQIGELTPQLEPLVRGSCDLPRLDDFVDSSREFKVFFSESCVRLWKNGWSNGKNPQLLRPYRISHDISSNSILSPTENPPFYKTKTFWGAMALIGLGAFLISQNHGASTSNGGTPPNHTDYDE